jgi:steroid delta-isomerase-like uncharacterized protein
MNTQKQIAAVWYEAFNKKDPELLGTVLGEGWYETPSAPDAQPGRETAKQLLVQLTTIFPDFKIVIQDTLEDGNKVVVRSQITGTQRQPFVGLPAKGRSIDIQAIDIQELKDGKIVRTWHSEDGMTGLHQLGFFER